MGSAHASESIGETMSQMIAEKPAEERLLRARAALVTGACFYGSLAMNLKLICAPHKTQTMATDGKHLFHNPSFVESLTEAELIGVLAHEVSHPALGHHVRRGNRELATWNKACDFAINPGLIRAGFVLPKGALIDPAFDGLGAEQIYAALKAAEQQQGGGGSQQQQPNAQQQPGGSGAGAQGKPDPNAAQQPDAGSGKPDKADGQGSAGSQPGGAPRGAQSDPEPAQPDPGGCGGVMDAAPDGASMAEAAAEAEARVRQAIAIATAQAGEMPGGMQRMLAELNRSRVPWYDVTARFIDDATTRELSWNRPDKRFLESGFFLPGKTHASIGCLVVIVDTSGSINAPVLNRFGSEAQAILDTGRVERMAVIFCDSAVQGTQEFQAGDVVKLEAKGGGGTRFDVAFRHAETRFPEAAAFIYLTDLDSRHFGPEPAAPVLWVQHGNKRRNAPFGEVVWMDPHA